MSDEADALERIWRAVAAIPRGRVDSYGGVARRAGLPGRARLVGHALKVAPKHLKLPWHRVLNASGRISLPEGSTAFYRQRRMLEAEGIRFNGARVERDETNDDASLDRLLWGPPGSSS
jgi:methylated-DNA-protein-cysteine methyltransferase-like protein